MSCSSDLTVARGCIVPWPALGLVLLLPLLLLLLLTGLMPPPGLLSLLSLMLHLLREKSQTSGILAHQALVKFYLPSPLRSSVKDTSESSQPISNMATSSVESIPQSTPSACRRFTRLSRVSKHCADASIHIVVGQADRQKRQTYRQT